MLRRMSDTFVLMRKEWRVLLGEPVMIGLLFYAFVFAVMMASGAGGSVRNVRVAIVDHDHSALSERLGFTLRRPFFLQPLAMSELEAENAMTHGRITFALQIPPHFTADLLAGRNPRLELLVDATAMSQAFNGAGYITSFVNDEISAYLTDRLPPSTAVPQANLRTRFNQNLESRGFMGVMELSQMITMIGVVLTGAAVLRERERGTMEHLLVLPIRASSILLSKILATVVVMILCVTASVMIVIKLVLGIAIAGSPLLYLAGAALYMFSVTSIGVFLALAVRSTQEFGLVCMLVIMPMMILSGVMTPVESAPWFIRSVMSVLPTPHFVQFSADVAFRAAGLELVWPALVTMGAIGVGFIAGALGVFRLSVSRSSA
ncbi:MAG: ABC transporter permease [Beijerinckiaceae bacterium]